MTLVRTSICLKQMPVLNITKRKCSRAPVAVEIKDPPSQNVPSQKRVEQESDCDKTDQGPQRLKTSLGKIYLKSRLMFQHMVCLLGPLIFVGALTFRSENG